MGRDQLIAENILFTACELGTEAELDATGRLGVPRELVQELGLKEGELVIGSRRGNIEIYCQRVYGGIDDAIRRELEDETMRVYRLYAAVRQPIDRDERSPETDTHRESKRLLVLDIDEELLRVLSKHPEHTYELSPRKFEELVARILKDLGCDVELTPATRDHGRDIIAYVRTKVAQFLLFVECKKYSQDRKVGVGVVRGVYGVQRIQRANKSLIVTTSYFSKDARLLHEGIRHEMELRDYDGLKEWLGRYEDI